MIRDNLFSPKSIAIVGVSKEKEKIGSVIFHNLMEGGYTGKIYPVNPKYSDIEGKECFKSVLDIKDSIDMVCIVIPSQFVSSVIDECIEKKVGSVIIISAGFKETGQEGKELEEDIAKKLKSAGIRLIGPNTLGFINNSENINLSFARSNPGDGTTAFISQSGAFITAILDMASKDNVGFSKVISIGNKADIIENELIEYLQRDKNTDSIALYLEEFSDGKDFIEIVSKVDKPIVIIAPGSSQRASEAIISHTGSLTSSYDTTLAAIRKANLIKVESSEEMFDTLKVLSKKKLPKGKKVAILTNAGGPGIMAVDFVEAFNLEVAEIGEKSKEKLLKNLPPFASVKNPIDILGDALLDRYEMAMKILLDDTNVDTLLLILTPQLVSDITGVAKVIVDLQNQSSKPIFACFLGGKEIEDGNKILRAYGLYFSNNIEDTVKLISKLTEYQSKRKSFVLRDISELKKRRKYGKEIEELLTDELQVLPDDIVEKISKEFHLDMPNQLITANYEEAVEFATKNFPVAIKATSKDLAHKTDYKALFLDIRTVSEFQAKFEELVGNISKITRTTSPNILIQEMIDSKAEFFIGTNRDGDSQVYEETGEGFGHLIAIGQGGIYTEIHSDIEKFLLPESIENIGRILDKTKISKLIAGYRGKPALAREALIECIEKVQKMLTTYPEIFTLDMNPVMITESRAVVVDIKAYIKK
ncbi:MAG: acetate--CoA ligase family protein [Candidatus Dojkabacteria bacterium]